MKKKMNKGLKIFLISLASVFAAAFVFFVFLAQASFSFIKSKNPNVTNANYFRDIVEKNPNLKDMPITKIAIMGAHDSLSYDINYKSKPNSSQDTYSNNPVLYNTCRGFIARYSKTQMDDVYTQLECGVRYIDARVTYIDGIYYTSHGLVSGTLEKSLLQILKFLDENPGEYIFFHIVYYYPGSSSWSDLDSYISTIKYNEKSLYDYVNYDTENKTTIGQVTYNDMTAGGTKAGVMIFGSHNETSSENYKYFRLTKFVVSCWQNKADSKRMVPAIVDRCKANEGHSDDYLFIIQTQLTPSFKYWFETACGWSVSDMNAKNNAKIIKNENFTEWISVMPVYLCDYSTTNYKNFNKTAMEKLKEYNLSLK